MNFQDFLKQSANQKGVGNTPQNIGQCVGLVEVWIKSFGFDQVWGDAKDLYANAPDDSFLKIPNTPTAVPQMGDIIIWSGEYNGGAGHTGISTGKGDANTFDCFEQNDPIGSTPHVKTYNYAYVVGFLRPKIAPVTPVPTPVMINDQTKIPASLLNSSSYPVTQDIEIQALRGKLGDFARYALSHPDMPQAPSTFTLPSVSYTFAPWVPEWLKTALGA